MTLHPVNRPHPAAVVISPENGGYARSLGLGHAGVLLHDTAPEG